VGQYSFKFPLAYFCVYLFALVASWCQMAYIHCGFSFFILSFFFLFWCLISAVTERISTKFGHIFTYDCCLKNLVWTPQASTPMGWGQKMLFWDWLWTLTELISAVGHDINLSIYRDFPTCPQIWWILVQKLLKTVSEILLTPWICTLGDTASLTTCTLYSSQQANFGAYYVVART